jgi:hypothetical protein
MKAEKLHPIPLEDDSGWDYADWTDFALDVIEAISQGAARFSTTAHREYVYGLVKTGARHALFMGKEPMSRRHQVIVIHWTLLGIDWLGATWVTQHTSDGERRCEGH